MADKILSLKDEGLTNDKFLMIKDKGYMFVEYTVLAVVHMIYTMEISLTIPTSHLPGTKVYCCWYM